MWPNALLDLCKIEHPIVLAPLAGGPGTPELAAAVCEAGALGSLGGGYLQPDALRDEIRRLRSGASPAYKAAVLPPVRAATRPCSRLRSAAVSRAPCRTGSRRRRRAHRSSRIHSRTR